MLFPNWFVSYRQCWVQCVCIFVNVMCATEKINTYVMADEMSYVVYGAISVIVECVTFSLTYINLFAEHDDLIKWKHCPRYWPFVWGIRRSPVNPPHKGQWCGTLMFSLIFAWINGWVSNLSKQSWGWLFETPSGPLWRNCNEYVLRFW